MKKRVGRVLRTLIDCLSMTDDDDDAGGDD